ncbi:Alpha/Beta hydrolase protein [Mycena maculata]|uniref:Alpha/Beta hydrolase protein n=1 Tax=Mycena maculata TaxID=230809 RepID=A0AAD7HBJ6_9AGAR|nr:Alpha/Beta hydrolase protein [Mycena maculata]
MSLVPLRTAVSLQVVLAPPPTSGVERKLAVLLHPWSRLGGRMNDPVLLELQAPLHAKGYHVLRYNTRGVGRSTGWGSFTGLSEADDLAALIEWAIGEVGGVQDVVVLGYSHGSLVASLQPPLPNIRTSHVLLSYPLSVRGFLTLFRHAHYAETLKALVSNEKARVLCVYGDADEFTGEGAYEPWKRELEEAGRVKVVEVKGGSHFWRGEDADEMLRIIREWVP